MQRRRRRKRGSPRPATVNLYDNILSPRWVSFSRAIPVLYQRILTGITVGDPVLWDLPIYGSGSCLSDSDWSGHSLVPVCPPATGGLTPSGPCQVTSQLHSRQAGAVFSDTGPPVRLPLFWPPPSGRTAFRDGPVILFGVSEKQKPAPALVSGTGSVILSGPGRPSGGIEHPQEQCGLLLAILNVPKPFHTRNRP